MSPLVRWFQRAGALVDRAAANRPLLVRGGMGMGFFFVGDLITQYWTRPSLATVANPAKAGVAAPSLSTGAAPSEPGAAAQKGKEAAGHTDATPREWYDPARSARTCTWRAVVWAPTATVFWHYLDRMVTVPGSKGVALKLAIDMLGIGPPIVYSFFVWCKAIEIGTEQGRVALREASDYALSQFPQVLYQSYIYWFPLHIATYSVVAPRNRIVWVNLCSIGFAMILSWNAYATKKHDD